jgi:uncharacterized protein (TIRG00374 family)
VKARLKQITQIVFFLALGVGLIWWFVAKLSKDELAELFNAARNASYGWIILAFIVSIASCYVRALRWRQLLKPVITERLPLRTLFFAIMSGYLTNLAVPRLGEVVRCAMLRKSKRIPVERTLGTVITERITDLLVFALIFFLALFVGFDVISGYVKENVDIAILDKMKLLLIFAFVILALIITGFLLARRKFHDNRLFIKLQNIVLGLWQGMKSITYLEKPFAFIGYSFLIWGLWICGTWTIFQGFETTSSLDISVALVVTILSAFGPMITPGGIGLYPLIFAQTLLIYNVSMPVGYAAGWLCWLVSQIAVIIFGLCGFVYFSQNKKI